MNELLIAVTTGTLILMVVGFTIMIHLFNVIRKEINSVKSINPHDARTLIFFKYMFMQDYCIKHEEYESARKIDEILKRDFKDMFKRE